MKVSKHMEDLDMLSDIQKTLSILVSSLSELNETASQIVCWIKNVEKTGTFPAGSWELARIEIAKKKLLLEIEEIKSLVSINTLIPDLENLLNKRLENLKTQLDLLDKENYS